MGEWHFYDYRLPWLLFVLSLLGFWRWFSYRHSCASAKSKCRTSTGQVHQVPTLNGNGLYYERAQWPIYEPRFNLRLSYLHGAVVCVKLGSKNTFAGLVQWLDSLLCRATVSRSDTIILINSLTDDDGTLKGLLNSCTSRAPSIAAGKYLSRGKRIVLMPYGPEWTRHRKAFASLLTRDKVKNLWGEALRYEAMVLVERLSLAEPGPRACSRKSGTKLVEEISRFTASTVLQIAYARRAATPDDPILGDLEVVSKNIASAFQPGRYWVERFPLLDIFPEFISPWKRKLSADHGLEDSLFKALLEDVEERLSSTCEAPRQRGTAGIVISAEECAATQLLRSQPCHGLDRDAIAYLAAGLFEAGTETTAMTINTFLLGAACCPEYTRRAQAEMDSLIASQYGDGRTVPGFQDLEGLQLLSAYVKEALRLTPSGASGVGHTRAVAGAQSFDLSSRNGKGPKKRLDMPAGATVLANIYGLHHDGEMFRDPWRFNPGRWLSCPAAGRKTLDHTYACFAFGFGKRICPGSTLACYSLTMAIALLLLCFDFSLTEEARRIYAEARKQNEHEIAAWERMFGDEARLEIDKREERPLREAQHMGSLEAGIGSMLIDAHIAFKLSRTQVGECVRLVCRESGNGLGLVRACLAT